MKRQPLFWKIFSSFLLVNVVSLIVLTWFSTYTIRQFQRKQARQHMETSIQILMPHLKPLWDDPRHLQPNIQSWYKNLSMRVTLLSQDGTVLADTHFDPIVLENHSNRPEIIKAQNRTFGDSVRFSSTEKMRNMYVASQVRDDFQTLGFIRLAHSMKTVDLAVWGFQKKIFLGWLILSFITAWLILRLSRRISLPLENFRASLQRYAYEETGIFHPDETPDFPKEVEQLAQVMDVMAARLDERTASLAQQRHEEEVILASMSEAVLAVDIHERILRINKSAARFFQLDAEACRGSLFQEIIRNETLNTFLKQTLNNLNPQIAEIRLFKPNPIFLEAHGSRLRDPKGALMGAVIVLNDVTRLKNLENVRRDFVGNVTHELRTPITSIKGFIETLLDGGIHDPEDTKRFLAIISRQADRLNNIIDDLLSLSKIEQREETTPLELQPHLLRPVLEAAFLSLQTQAAEKNITLLLECPPELEAELHPSLFEQAVMNLIGNAVKFSESDSCVTVSASSGPSSISLRVTDEGPGIPQSHLPRLFERFYRVDKGRSRGMGGTGLGLSIVKHIVAAHHGQVTVESQVGKGSTFTIQLPLIASQANEP